MFDITIIGAAICDILTSPIDPAKLTGGSSPAETITLQLGGDGANQAVILSRLGKKIDLLTKIGQDLTGTFLLQQLKEHKISTDHVKQAADLDTGINIVLIDETAERSFITNRNGSLRKLTLEDVPAEAFHQAPIISFASIFIFPDFTPAALEKLFFHVKDAGCTLCADMTTCKNGETLEDMKDALKYIDYLFPNYEEAALLSGLTDLDDIAEVFLDYGVGCIVIKNGSKGCLIRTQTQRLEIPAVPNTNCIDTTGAGDNFVAGFLYGLSEGMSLKECGCFANATASAAVECIGATTGVRSLAQVQERTENLF